MKNKNFHKWTAHLLAVILAVALPGCGSDVPKLLEPIGSDENVVEAVRGEMYNMTATQTSVVPQMQYVRMGSGQGLVKDIPVSLGDQVQTGDVLVELDGSGLESQVAQIDEEIEEMTKANEYLNALAETQIQVAQLELEKLRAEGASQEAIDAKSAEVTTRQDRLSSDRVEQEKELAELQLQKMEGGYSGTPLTSPCNGTVAALRAGSIGDTIESGAAVAAIAVEGSKQLRGEYVAEEVLNSAHEVYAIIGGERYEITPSPYSQNELSMLTMFESTLYGSYYLNDADDVEYGEMASVVVVTDYREDVLYIPDNALYSDVDSYYVYVQTDDGERERHDVEIGFQWNNAVEILSGIEEGAVLYAK